MQAVFAPAAQSGPARAAPDRARRRRLARFSRRNTWTRPITSKTACFSASQTTCSRCAACPCATSASWTATCSPCRPPRTPRTVRSSWPAWVTTSRSSASCAHQHLIELHAENPDYKTIVVEPGEPFEIEGLRCGLDPQQFPTLTDSGPCRLSRWRAFGPGGCNRQRTHPCEGACSCNPACVQPHPEVSHGKIFQYQRMARTSAVD